MTSSRPTSRPKKPTVLVIDDEPDILDLLYRTLHREFRVLRASSGPDALEILAQEDEIAVIVSDQRMPLMSGTEFLSLTAAQYPDIMRIIVTGYTDVDDLVEAINTGKVFKYVTKPWDDEDLKDSVRKAVATHNVLRSRTQTLQKSLRREELINGITAAIRSSLDPTQIFSTITEQLGTAMDADGCTLSLWTPSDEYMQCVGFHENTHEDGQAADLPHNHVHGEPSGEENGIGGAKKLKQIDPVALADPSLPGALPRSYVPIASNPVLQRVIASKGAVAVDDLQRDVPSEALPLRQQARSLLVLPLLAEGKIIGSISLRHKELHPWKPEDIELAEEVSVQAAIAVQQARLYQKTRKQAEQLLALDKQKNEFFQNVSHEFRTPLTLMIGPLEAAVDNGDDLPGDQAAIALRNSRRLLRLVNQLLDIQRIDAQRLQPTFRPLNLTRFTEQIVEAFQDYSDRKGISLVTHLDDGPPAYVDIERFDKVLYNLLSNAMKFTPSGGTITVSLGCTSDSFVLKVQDTGIGIRDDQLPHLFERFRQAEGSVSRSYEGTGLGLALVQELVGLHGGKVSVDSVYGQGSTFTVWLQKGATHLPADQVLEQPIEHEASRAAVELADLEGEIDAAAEEAAIATMLTKAPPSAEDPTAQDLMSPASSGGASEESLPEKLSRKLSKSEIKEPATVLVVDDNSDLRIYVSSILKSAGYEVVTARDGDEGFRTAQAKAVDAVVTDLMMPRVSGLDLIRMVREDEELQGTPVILLTAKADDDTRLEGVEQGADAYLAKPFNARELLAEVRNLLALKANERRVAELNQYLTKSVLQRFLPGSMVKKAAAGELSLDLKPEPRLVTVLFSDIVGFTQLSNTLRSRKVAEVLNEYLSAMSEVVFENQGTVDKFMGDAVLALFGAPEDATPNQQVQRAVTAARQMHQRLRSLNAKWEEQGMPAVQFRCGIHQGTAVVGMFGSSQRSDYTAIGPCVNIASRIQAAADPGMVLISAAVADYLDEEEIQKVRPLELKGVDETVLTFSVILD
ncbi:MAG: response regulator [Cyanobacteria bacterium P01_F01_bin.153]